MEHTTRNKRLSAISASVALALSASAALYAEPQPARVPEVSVIATRTEQPTDDVAASVSVIDDQRMERMLAKSLRDLVRYEPNVSVTSDPNRFGVTGFNIRGLTDNRVLILIDGVRMPDFFDFGPGPFNVATRNLVDLDALKRAETLRGPASSLYGSDALGGVVAFVTKDPKDYLVEGGRRWYPSIRSGWSEADRSWNNTATFAASGSTFGGLLIYTHREAHELETSGENASIGPGRTVANPQESKSDNLLLKLVAAPGTGHTLRLTGERFTSDVSTDILSLNAGTPRTSALAGDDDTERWRVSLDHEYHRPSGGALASVRWTLYYQDSSSIEDSEETRTNTTATCSGVTAGINTCRIPREFTFEQKIAGATAQLQSDFGETSGGAVAHQLIYGVDYAHTNTTSLRNATIFNLTTGTVSRSLAGDAFPVRDFPGTDTQRLGVFVQDQIALADDRLLVTPAVRYDYYDVNVKPDAIYLANAPPNIRAADFSDSAVSPKLGVLYKITSALSVYGQYSHGFRSPPFDDLNASFRNPVQSYALIPNAQLESETSRGLEAGIRASYARLRFGGAVFYNRYRDFIDAGARLACPGDPACVPGFLATFQSVNRARVRIRGIEGKAEFRITDEWSTVAAAGLTRGEDSTTGQPINTINPVKGVIGLNYAASGERYGGSLIVTTVGRQRRVDESAGPLFRSPGYTLVDLTAWWNITTQSTLTVGAFNLLDRKYWLWSDLSRAALRPTDAAVDRYSQSPRNVSMSFKYVF
jgi:hemoglobin/transferrin/lactoferrin receptor protein